MKEIIIVTLLLLATPVLAVGWETTGNSAQNGEFIGTIDQTDFVIKTNGFDRLVFKTQVNGTATNMVFPTNLAFFKLAGTNGFLQATQTETGLYSQTSFLNLNSTGANFDGGTNVNIKQGAELRLFNGINYSGFKASPNATNITWTLPNVDGIGALQSDGNGNLSFQASNNYTIQNGAYFATLENYTIEMDEGDIVLPDNAQTGKHYEIISTGQGEVRVHGQSGQDIGNVERSEMYVISNGDSVTLVFNGGNWRIIR